MYKLHLILKYLRKRRIAWVSLIAVALCTAMVIVVISVMGGWLRMFRESFHGLTGDVIVHAESLSGFPYYQEMIEKLEKMPNVKAAVPTIDTFGLANISNFVRLGVQVRGYPIDKIGLVNDFPHSLYRQYRRAEDAANDRHLSSEERQAAASAARDGEEHPSFSLPLPADVYRSLKPNARNHPESWPGMIIGVGVGGLSKNSDGTEKERGYMYERWVHLTVLAISEDQVGPDLANNVAPREYWIVDDSRTQIWQYDQSTVYVPFDVLQRDLKMDAHEEENPDTHEIRKIPARTRDLQIAGKPGVDLQLVKRDAQQVVGEVAAAHNFPADIVRVETWEESQATFISAIEKEKLLVTMLFSLISIVAVFLIFCIFYMIVVEKTRDIGIIKSVGATNAGVAGIFLGYGLAIGVVGSGVGLLFGYLIVHNINFLHTEMGKLLGVQIWNPEVYAFDTIPNKLNPNEVTVILVVALISAVLGALVPAVRAAKMQPVEALRWE